MKLNPETFIQRRSKKLKQWHKWFAWYPVWLDKYPDKEDDKPAGDSKFTMHGIEPAKGDRVWLQFVQRRAYYWVAIDYVACTTWHYK